MLIHVRWSAGYASPYYTPSQHQHQHHQSSKIWPNGSSAAESISRSQLGMSGAGHKGTATTVVYWSEHLSGASDKHLYSIQTEDNDEPPVEAVTVLLRPLTCSFCSSCESEPLRLLVSKYSSVDEANDSKQVCCIHHIHMYIHPGQRGAWVGG
ncbi:hypothetical protein EJ05DRAFT_472178 [Pseudovirgaria hyperparasitica]|uniref:Uncharacterized protein n=1 Tax=Pseudovirgaria hyperparasitica TaxID=470096 RepID=A0A6A6WM33_9PEZI|nr:uncharacterized protein EJ05DRAFT_472178 [Pseudovirgaria hyperparasitica]KAF2763264.1 hypothetical protein EJ05DRAFT_472178 [Pseudovirgaria hyperparasitica]